MVSQNAVERALGKLVTDDEFSARFLENRAAARWEAGLPVSALELDALPGLAPAAIARCSRSLDGRIRRLCVSGTPSRAAQTKHDLNRKRSDADAEDAT